MNKFNIQQNRHEGNAPFVAIPWAETLRLEKEKQYIPAKWIQLYPVIACFQNNGCYLSQDKLAAYAGMRKADVKPTILTLVEGGWLNEDKYKTRKTYKIKNRYNSLYSEQFYMIGTELVKNGIWAALGQTRQVIYSILQAWTKHAAYVDPVRAFCFEKDFTFLKRMYVDGEYKLNNCSYLRLDWYEPDKIISSAQRCGIDCSKKTFQRVTKDLLDWGLMFYMEVAGGYFFPRNPGLKANGFDERMEKIDKAQSEHKISYAAKRAASAAKKRNQENRGNSKFVKILYL